MTGVIFLNDYNFGNFVCSLREKKGFTQADIAKELNITPAAVSKWENGESKPRVEILFRLAEILEVRPEELMAGKYLNDEVIDPEAIKQINEKYEYLRRIDLHATASVKIKRMFAFIIDWNIIGFLELILLSFVPSLLLPNEEAANDSKILLTVFVMLLFPLLVSLRDLIFGGRSIGKRIFGLTVLNRQTAEKAKAWQIFVRDIFFFAVQVDWIVMLGTGRSIGDFVANTAVVPKKQLSETYKGTALTVKNINEYIAPERTKAGKRKNKWLIITVLIIVAVFVIAMAALSIWIENNVIKEADDYKTAYSYLVNSEAFEKTGKSEDDISFKESTRFSEKRDGEYYYEAYFLFKVGKEKFEIICHFDGEKWYVCDECTKFN